MNSPSPAGSRFAPLLRRLLLSASLFAVAVSVQAQTRYTITTLGTIGGTNTTPTAINASGTVVGYEWFGGRFHRPFIYRNGVMTEIGSYGDAFTEATGINAAGTVVVSSLDASATNYRSFTHAGTVVTELPTLGGTKGTSAQGINDSGTIVGYFYTNGNASYRAFSLAGGVVITLGALSTGTSQATAIGSSGIIVGYSDTFSGTRHAFRYVGVVLNDIGTLGGSNSYALGVNASGVIVGYSNDATNRGSKAFVYSGNTMTDIGTLGAGSMANAINSGGTVVGVYGANPDVPDRGFVYTPLGGMVDLNTVVLNLAASGFSKLMEATAINDAGQIVGRGAFGSGFRAYLLTPNVTVVAPTITADPQSSTVAPGATVTFNVAATSTGLSYQWRFNNTTITGATQASYTIPSASTANEGIYTVVVTNEGGSVTSKPAILSISTAEPGRIVNMSIRSTAGTGAQTLIVGAVIGGAGTSGTKPLLVRAIGPALTGFGVPGALADPILNVFAGSSVVTSNDNWNGDAQVTSVGATVGAFALSPATSKDAALYAPSLAARDYTIQITGAGGTTGIALAELYDASTGAFSATTPQLVNVSARTQVGTGADILIAGFSLGGATPRTLLIRAIGPTLTAFGVPGALADPQLALFSGSNKLEENNDWGSAANAAQIIATSAQLTFALTAGSKDSVILTTLQPGSYTAQVSGVANGTGIALIEIYLVP